MKIVLYFLIWALCGEIGWLIISKTSLWEKGGYLLAWIGGPVVLLVAIPAWLVELRR